MTPKEKAQNMVNNIIISTDFFVQKDNAIICALIAVDEILQDGMLEQAPFMHNGKDLMKSNFVGYKDYWQQVKTEIEKL